MSQEGAQRLVACVHRAACLRLDLAPASALAQPQGSAAGHRAALQAQAMGPEAVDCQEEADRCGPLQGGSHCHFDVVQLFTHAQLAACFGPFVLHQIDQAM